MYTIWQLAAKVLIGCKLVPLPQANGKQITTLNQLQHTIVNQTHKINLTCDELN